MSKDIRSFVPQALWILTCSFVPAGVVQAAIASLPSSVGQLQNLISLDASYE